LTVSFFVTLLSSGKSTTLQMIGAFLQPTASRIRFRNRASLKIEPVALRHQVIVPTWQRHERIRLFSADRLAVPSAAAVPQYPGTRQTGDRDQMAPQRHPHLLAMAITLHRPKISVE
jgi:ABC-type branched-subunit amino acid transport system ATPase component